MADWNTNVIEEFRANDGKVGGAFGGMDLLLLTHTGAKSGKSYTNPLAFTRDGDRIVIIASKGGADSNPDWFHNLVAHPDVTVELGGEKFEAHAQQAHGDERTRLYDEQAKKYPTFNEYKEKTSREIPVFVLTRA